MQVKHQETSRSILKNVLFGFSTWILPLGLSFLATPIIVKTLGNTEYGIYALILGFVGYSFNFNLGRAITKYVAEYRASGETEKLRDVISSTFFLNLLIGAVGVLIVCSSAEWLVINALKLEIAAQNRSVTALYIAALIIFATSLNQIFSSIIQGVHRFDVYSKILNAGNLALLIGNILLAIYGFGLLILLIWNLLITIFTTVLFAVSAKRLVPEFKLSFRFDKETLKQVLRYSSGIVGYQILSNFLLLFERGWITRHLGPESLTFYVVPMTLSFFIHGFVSSLIIVIFPLASQLKNEREKLLRLYSKATKTVCFFVFFFAAALIVEGNLFLILWMGAPFAAQTYLLLVIHTITFSIVAIQTISWQMTEGLGNPAHNFYIFAVCLIINVLMILGLTESLGNVGIALGRLAGFGTIFLSVFYIEKWAFQKVQVKFWLKLASILSVATITAIAAMKIISRCLPQTWISLAAQVAGGGIVYLSAVWLMGFVTEDEKELVRRLFTDRKNNGQKN